MKKYVLSFLIVVTALLLNVQAQAQMKNVTNDTDNSDTISVTGYMNYPPLGYIEKRYEGKNEKPYFVYRSVFEEIIEDFKQNTNLKIAYKYDPNTSEEAYLSEINRGGIDIFLGAYYDTQKFHRTELIYPSILNNPVTLITMPETASKLKNLSQLKQMKGIACSQDQFSDYVQKKIQEYPVAFVDTPYEMFEKLYTGEVDFAFASQYFGIIEASKLGIRDYLSFSKQVIWNMPLFIGISQLSPNRKFLVQKLSSYSENPKNKTKIEQKLQNIIQEIELQNRGVVPPAFIKQENSDEQTSSLDLLTQEDKIQNK